MQYELSAQPVLLLFALMRRLREFCRVDTISSHWKLGRHTSERRGTVVAVVGIDGHTADLHHFSNLQSRQKDVAVRTHDVVALHLFGVLWTEVLANRNLHSAVPAGSSARPW